MTVFEKLTESPEVLGAFLQSLPCLEGPWDAEFQERFCSECGRATCDPACEFERFRNNPGWWLTLEAAEKTHVIELDPAELERPLTAEEETAAERVKPMFRFAFGKDHVTGDLRVIPINPDGEITLHSEAEARFFINRLLECYQKG